LLADDWCACLRGVSTDQPRQQVEPRFVLENQHPALASRPPLQVRPDFDAPAPDRFLVPLDGASDRHLGRPAQLLEQTPDVTFVVADAELFLDDQGDAGARPDLSAEAVGLRPVPEELRDQALLLGGKSWSRAGGGVVPERLRTVLAGTGEPTADRLFSGPESRSDVALIPALLLQFQRPQPPPRTPILRHEVRTLHTQFYRPQHLTNSARLSVSSLTLARCEF